MKQGFLVPVYRHAKTAVPIAEKLAASGLPIIIVDDGNSAEDSECLVQAAKRINGVFLVRLEKNSGKGAAAFNGFKKAGEIGLTHVLMADADGQHDIERAAFFLEESARYPDKVICGYPLFDETAPKSRVTGRRISNFWAAIVTLSSELKDTHCGFRVYPVQGVLRIMRFSYVDRRMGFDTELLVRLYWNRALPVYHPIKVIYPEGGISNFRMVKDNIRISFTFSRLFFGMLLRLPVLTIRKIKKR
jgi:glycosyltransferase involved in cell wall biosynthesis